MKNPIVRSHHLVIALAIVITIITGVSLIDFHESAKNEMEEKFKSEQLHHVQDLSRDIKSYLTNRLQLIDVLTSLSAFQNLDTKYIASQINIFLFYEKKNYVKTLSLYNETGTIIYSSNAMTMGHKLAESEIFKWAKKPENKGKHFISSPIKVTVQQEDSIHHLHFAIATPIYKSLKKNHEQKFVGVVTELLDFDNFVSELITSSYSKKEKEHLWIMEKGGTLLFHADHPKMVFANIKKQNKTCINCHVSFSHIDTMFVKKEGNIEFQLKKASQKLAGFTRLEFENLSWILVLNLPLENISQFVNKNLIQSYLLLGMIALTFFIISYLIYRSYRLRVKTEAENEQLIEKGLLKEKIEESEKRYRNLVEFSPDAIAVHCEGKVVYANKACAKLFHAEKPDDLLERPILEFVHPDYHELARKRMKEAIQNSERSPLVEEKFIRIDGSIVDVDVIAIPTIFNSKSAVQVVIRDISERKKTEERLLESEKRYKSLFNDSKAVMLLIDPESAEILDANTSACNFYRWTFDEITKMKISDINLLPVEVVRNEMKKALHGKKDYFIFKHQLANGEVRDVEVYSGPIQIKGKTVLYSINHDITKRRLAEEALKENEIKYRLLFDNNPQPMWVYDSETLRFLTVNRTAIKRYGYSKEEFLSMTLKDIRPPEDVPRLLENIPRSDNELKISGAWRHKLKNGTIIFVEIHSHNIKYENKQGRLILADNITDRLKTEEKLRSSENKYRNLAENSLVGIYATTTGGEFKYMNNALYKMLEYESAEELISVGANKMYKKIEDRDRFIKALRERMHISNYENIFITKTKKIKNVIISASLSGDLLTGMIMDNTERKHTEAELEKYRNHLEEMVKIRTEELHTINMQLNGQIEKGKEIEMMLHESLEKEKELSNLKSTFISTVSHEFRTPLTLILSNAELLQINNKNSIDSKFNNNVNRIINSVDSMTSLLDEVLTINRADSGKVKLKLRKIDLLKLCQEVIKVHKENFGKKHEISLTYKSVITEVVADTNIISQILNNLIGNAIKYSNEGSQIQLLVNITEHDIHFQITDSGIGIDKEDIPHLFEPFYRGRNVREVKGSGLGLSIVQKSTHLHGGSVKVESEKGKGSRFFVSLKRFPEDDLQV